MYKYINIKKQMKLILPQKIRMVLAKLILNFKRIIAMDSRTISSREIDKHKKVDVLFFVIHHSVWKLDPVYKKFEEDVRFNPVIVICPHVTVSQNDMLEKMVTSEEYFKNKNFNVVETYRNGEWLDVKMTFTNKIIFFTNPHNLTRKQYQWSTFKDTIKYYVPYHHQIDAGQWDSQWNSQFHLSMTKLFYIDTFHKRLAKEKMLNNGRNVIITGYPATESLLENDKLDFCVWKKQASKKLKVIFSPHHTIEYNSALGVCEFLNIADLMRDISLRYRHQIQFSFKPHPLLKEKLKVPSLWGKAKVDEYYRYWEEAENTQLDEGEYYDLFLTSDAMIHDSGSFLAEYLYVNKPVMYLYNGTTKSRFNEYGLNCLDCCYTDEDNDVDKFLLDLIHGKDIKKKMREELINSKLKHKEDVLPSLNIYNEVCDDLFSK